MGVIFIFCQQTLVDSTLVGDNIFSLYNFAAGLTEEMIAENQRVREELLQEEEKKKDLLAAADTGKSNQKYKQLEFLLQV